MVGTSRSAEDCAYSRVTRFPIRRAILSYRLRIAGRRLTSPECVGRRERAVAPERHAFAQVGLGVVGLLGYVCRDDVKAGALDERYIIDSRSRSGKTCCRPRFH